MNINIFEIKSDTICSYCGPDIPVFEQCQILHPEVTLWWFPMSPLEMELTTRNPKPLLPQPYVKEWSILQNSPEMREKSDIRKRKATSFRSYPTKKHIQNRRTNGNLSIITHGRIYLYFQFLNPCWLIVKFESGHMFSFKKIHLKMSSAL